MNVRVAMNEVAGAKFSAHLGNLGNLQTVPTFGVTFEKMHVRFIY